MAKSHNRKTEIAERRAKVAELYVQGHSQSAIAAKLNVTQPTVSADLRRIMEEWRKSAVRDFDMARMVELQKLDRIESEAWAAWERSQKPAQAAVINDSGASQQTRKIVKNQHGDLRALDVILKCQVARRALLGLDAPVRIAPVMPDGQEPFRLAVAHLDVAELRTLKKLRERQDLRIEKQEVSVDAAAD